MSLLRGPIGEVRIDMPRRVWRRQMSRRSGFFGAPRTFFTDDIATGPD